MNEDVLENLKNELQENIENGNTNEFVNKLANMMVDAENKMMEKYQALQGVTDESILVSRGVYSLTSEEKAFYNSLVENAKNGVTNVTVALPVTVENRIFDDLKKDHPLLSKINFVNTKGLTEWLITSEVSALATWGDLCDAITAKNNATLAKIQFAQYKLSAWMPVCLTAIELGLEWLDLYVRTVLGEAIAEKLEDGIINGTGQKMPVGMIKTVDITNQTVPAVDKAATAITDLSIKTLGGIAKELTNGGKRKVGKMIMIVNPLDYYDKVLPAITVQGTNGEYTKEFAIPVEIIESTAIAEGKAVFGLADKYFATLGFGKDGKVTYSDDFKFLDDVRAYKTKLVAYGTPKDNASFVVRTITNLKEAVVKVKNEVVTP